ncbi:MAG: flagellar protein FlbT [Enterovirga sp.]|nr:flagellar protein FlbT [Enterovirga sp.]
MPLRIELAPNERLILGDVSIRNGARRSEFIVETQTSVLRERDIITEGEADTPCKRLYLSLEAAYLSADPVPAETRFMAQANEIMAAAPSAAPFIAEIFGFLLAGDYYRALKSAKRLLAFEEELLGRVVDPGPARAAAG